nr:WAS/WASL-interacting protein family member 3-like [Penaeus vannamei]
MYPQRQCPSPPAPHPSPSGAFPSRPRPQRLPTPCPVQHLLEGLSRRLGGESVSSERSAWPGGVCRPQELVYKQAGVVGGNDPWGRALAGFEPVSTLDEVWWVGSQSRQAGRGVGSVRERASAPPRPRLAPRAAAPQPHHERTHVETQTSFQSSVPSTPTPTPPSPSPPMRPDSPPFPGRARGHPAPHPSPHHTPLYHPLSIPARTLFLPAHICSENLPQTDALQL